MIRICVHTLWSSNLDTLSEKVLSTAPAPSSHALYIRLHAANVQHTSMVFRTRKGFPRLERVCSDHYTVSHRPHKRRQNVGANNIGTRSLSVHVADPSAFCKPKVLINSAGGSGMHAPTREAYNRRQIALVDNIDEGIREPEAPRLTPSCGLKAGSRPPPAHMCVRVNKS